MQRSFISFFSAYFEEYKKPDLSVTFLRDMSPDAVEMRTDPRFKTFKTLDDAKENGAGALSRVFKEYPVMYAGVRPFEESLLEEIFQALNALLCKTTAIEKEDIKEFLEFALPKIIHEVVDKETGSLDSELRKVLSIEELEKTGKISSQDIMKNFLISYFNEIVIAEITRRLEGTLKRNPHMRERFQTFGVMLANAMMTTMIVSDSINQYLLKGLKDQKEEKKSPGFFEKSTGKGASQTTGSSSTLTASTSSTSSSTSRKPGST